MYDEDLLILGSRTDEFLTEFKRIFNERKITPKMHHLVHYPRYIRMFGPLLNVWAMRFEGKQAYLKKVQKCLTIIVLRIIISILFADIKNDLI